MQPDPGAEEPAGLGWASFRDLTSDQFTEKFNEYKGDYIMTDIDAYPGNGGLRYSMVWERNEENRAWAEWRDMNSDQYSAKWNEYKELGYRPSDVESYRSNGNNLYAGIWVDNTEGFGWSSHRGLTSEEYSNLFDEKVDEGFRVIDIEAYATDAGIRYAAIWYENVDDIDWFQYRNMTRTEYQEKVDELSADGFRQIDYESYTNDNNQQRYAAIWVKNSGNLASAVRTNREEIDYANFWRQYMDEGYRLIDFERYETPEGTKYGGVWVENASRYRWEHKAAINNLVENYQSANNVKGISVALIHKGNTVYRRGFGWADEDAGKKSHGRTVYLTASVSKVIGGTLAAKIEDEGVLADGTSVRLDLDNPTSNYISRLPAGHDHTVLELFAHLGCIWHYDTGPEPAITYYANSLSAAQQIWGTAPLAGCNPGTNRNYSTHGFTFAAAAIEQATGRSIAQLVEEEIGEQFGLNSIKVQYRESSLRSNYERAMPYTDAGNETTYADNSWKVLGGGIEASAVDLARFGWKTLDGQIVSPTARDNRLWQQVPNSSNGIAWIITSQDGRSIVEHNGSWTGARSHLRVYNADQLVIAVLTNQRGHDPSTLVRDIGNAVLD